MCLSLLQIILGVEWGEVNKLLNIKVNNRIRVLFTQNLSHSLNCSLKHILGNSNYKDYHNDFNVKN